MYTHANRQGGNGNTGTGFYFKLIPGCPSRFCPSEMFCSLGETQHFSFDEKLALRERLASGLKMNVAADPKDSFLINTGPERGLNI